MIHYEDLQKLKHKYGFFVLIFATTAMFFLQDKNVLLLCDAQPCLTLCNPMDYTAPGILQAWILEWAAIPFSKGIFPTQGSNPGLPHCTRILYQLSCQGSPLPKPLTKVLLCITPGGLNPQEREKEPIIFSKTFSTNKSRKLHKSG